MRSLGFAELIIISLVCLAPLALAAIVALVVVLTRQTSARCPYCGERIERDAPYCSHCGRDLQKGEAEEAEEA